MQPGDQDRGIAIVAALWATMILAVIVLSVQHIVLADAKVDRGQIDAMQLNAIADGAVNITILAMLSPAATQPPVNARPFPLQFAGYEIRLSDQDEAGKIDLNATSPDTLRQLLIGTGLGIGPAQQIADSIVAWREPAAGDRAASGARHARFQSVEELQLVAGMTPNLYRQIAPLVTVYSQTPWIDPAYSSVPVLSVFRASDSTAETALRQLEEERVGLRPPAASPGVAVGHAFTITAEVRGPASARVVRTAVVRITGQARVPLLVYRWS